MSIVTVASFLGGTEMLVILLAIIFLFGARKIPELARGLGQSVREFRKAVRENPEKK
jgi:sec-independent protein translocase protein TatA